jgi:hypothetical protein
MAIFQKNRAHNRSQSAKTSDKFNVLASLLWIMDKIKTIFFSIERKNKQYFSRGCSVDVPRISPLEPTLSDGY